MLSKIQQRKCQMKDYSIKHKALRPSLDLFSGNISIVLCSTNELKYSDDGRALHPRKKTAWTRETYSLGLKWLGFVKKYRQPPENNPDDWTWNKTSCPTLETSLPLPVSGQ